MSTHFFKNIKGMIVLICGIGILLTYTINVSKIKSWFTNWQNFGKPPINVNEIYYFISDTSNVIGYKDPASGETVSCTTTIAYVRSDKNDSYRCCDTGNGISCLPAIYSIEIPASDPECVRMLQKIYGIPDSLKNTKYYRIFASCRMSDDWDVSEITIVKIENDGQIFWKAISKSQVREIDIVLKCILAPLLLFIIAIIWGISMRRK